MHQSISKFHLHDVLDLGSIQRVDNGLALDHFQLLLAVKNRLFPALLQIQFAEPLSGSSHNVLSNVVVRESPRLAEEASVERSRLCHRFLAAISKTTGLGFMMSAPAIHARPPMLSKSPYAAPQWAKHLHPIPSHFYSLGQLPTPIHRWNLPGLPQGTRVWIKRDDLSGMQVSGNKIRKLEFLLADAKAQGADCVITIGGIQSNHCRSTAVAARYLDLDCFLILRTSRTKVNEDPGLEGNLLVERLVGAHVELVSKEDYTKYGSETLGARLAEKLKADGRKPYFIPVGGSNSLGTWGYIQAGREIEEQLHAGVVGDVKEFDDIVMACGSGGTTAGLALASHLSSLNAKVHAYGVCDSPDYFFDYIQGLFDGLSADASSRDLIRMIDSKGSGYAVSTEEELKLVKVISEVTGVILDPVYSGKALGGFLKDMEQNPSYWEGKNVLFIHTGGLLGMFDKLYQLQPLVGKWKSMTLT